MGVALITVQAFLSQGLSLLKSKIGVLHTSPVFLTAVFTERSSYDILITYYKVKKETHEIYKHAFIKKMG